MNTTGFLAVVGAETNTLAGWVDGQAPSAPVPTCPEWTLADLVDHVGATQRMVAMLVGERLADPTSVFARQAEAPADSSHWGEWLREGADQARRAFASVDDDTPVWDPSGAEAGVPFWSRRLLGEACVHRADAASALGTSYELAPEPAVEAVEDWLDTMTSTGYWENKPAYAEAMRGDGQSLLFHATDAPGNWLARREPDRIALERRRAEADVMLSGPAVELLLVISRRRTLEQLSGVQVHGDRALLDHWIEQMNWVTGG